MWIHDGFAGNPLYDLAVQLGLPLSPRQDYASGATYPARNRRAGLSVYTPYYTQLVPAISRMRSTPGTPDRSVADVYGEWLANNPGLTQEQIAQANLL